MLPLSHPNGPNLEQLASLDPDLVFSSQTWAKGNQAMERASGSTSSSTSPRSIDGAFADTFKIGAIVGRKHYARDAPASRCAKQVARPRKGITRAPEGDADPRRRPHPVHLPPQQLGRRHRHQGRRRAADRRRRAPSSGFERISDEVVVAENPDVIIAVPHANEDDIPSLTEYLRTNPAWSSTTAAQQRPRLRLGRQLAAAGRHRHRPHDPQGPPRLPAELSRVGAPDPGLRGAARRARRRDRRLAGARRGQGAARRGDRHPASARAAAAPTQQIVETLRLPRTVEALVVGAALGDRRGDPAGGARPTRSPRPT